MKSWRSAGWIAVAVLVLAFAGCRPSSSTGIGGAYDHPVVGENLVYVGGIDGYLYAIDRVTGLVGETGWRRPEDPPEGPPEEMPDLVAGPTLDRETNIVVVGSEDGNLYAYDATNGDLKWSFETGDKIWSTPVIKDGTIYFGSHDKNVYAVNLEDGLEKWRFPTGGIVAGRPLLFRNLVVIGSFDRKLYALDADNGIKQWEVDGDHWFWAGAVADDRTIFAPSMDGNIYAVDRDGNLLWKYDLEAPIASRPALISGALAVVGKNGDIKLLNTTPSPLDVDRLIDTEAVGGEDVRAPLFVTGNTLYVGTMGNTLVRIDLKGAGTSRLDLDETWCYNNETNAKC